MSWAGVGTGQRKRMGRSDARKPAAGPTIPISGRVLNVGIPLLQIALIRFLSISESTKAQGVHSGL
jgi:hypothetical protein